MQSAIDPSNPNLSVTQFYEALVEQLGLEVEKSEWKTELVFDGQGKAVLNKDGTQKRKKYKLRRINSDSWKLFELFCEHRQNQVTSRKSLLASEEGSLQQISKQQSIKCDRPWRYAERNRSVSVTNQAHSNTCDLPLASCDLINDSVPTTPENLYESGGGWNMGKPHTGQGIEGSFSAQKLEEEIAAEFPNVNESSSSINTQTTKSNDVPTTTKKLYENGAGWNTNQSHTEQEIKGNFLPRKIEPTNLEIQDCLKQLRQVKTADDYWVLYEQKSQLVEEAWKLLRASEQLWIQQICNEGIDPFEKWLEGVREASPKEIRCWLWHPFAEHKWGLATIKQVVRGACGFIYVLREDGFGLHLGRNKLHLIAPTNMS